MRMYSLLVIVVLCLTGCITRYPMGLNQVQWQSLSPAQQAECQAKQYALDQERQNQANAARMEATRRQEIKAQEERDRIGRIYANARYGDIVQVNVQGGFIMYAGKRYPYEPVSFDLVKGEKKHVAFHGRGLQTIATQYNVRRSEDGNTIYFDDSFRQRIVMINQDWERGQKYQPAGSQNDVGVSISGMTFFVKLKDLPGAPQRVIIERR